MDTLPKLVSLKVEPTSATFLNAADRRFTSSNLADARLTSKNSAAARDVCSNLIGGEDIALFPCGA